MTTDTSQDRLETHEEPTTGPEGTEPATAPPEEPESFDRAYVTELRDEAATHRVRARDLETERDQLRQRLLDDNVRHLAGTVLADPGDLTTFVEVAELTGEDGLPNADAILSAARQLARDKPHLASRRPAGPIEQGARDEPAGVDLAGMLRTRAG